MLITVTVNGECIVSDLRQESAKRGNPYFNSLNKGGNEQFRTLGSKLGKQVHTSEY